MGPKLSSEEIADGQNIDHGVTQLPKGCIRGLHRSALIQRVRSTKNSVKHLSGGERNRLPHLARMLKEAQLLLLDESDQRTLTFETITCIGKTLLLPSLVRDVIP